MDKPVIQEYRDQRTGERCVRIDHPSGLPIFVCPKPGYQSAYAVFAVKYGSVDTAFVENGREVEVPAGHRPLSGAQAVRERGLRCFPAVRPHRRLRQRLHQL